MDVVEDHDWQQSDQSSSNNPLRAKQDTFTATIDTTGAGDAFNGAFCVGLSENKNYKQSIEFASLVAGISVTKEGAANSMPNLNEIKANTNEI